MESKVDVELLARSEYEKALQPKTPPLKKFHAMLEHTLKMLPEIDDEVQSAAAIILEKNRKLSELVSERDTEIEKNNALLKSDQYLRSEVKRLNEHLRNEVERLEASHDTAKDSLEATKSLREHYRQNLIHVEESTRYRLGCFLTFPFRVFSGEHLFPDRINAE